LTLALLACGGSAWADIGDLKGTAPGSLDNQGFFLDPDTCGGCHGEGVDGDFTFLPHDTWAGTMMANATRDPVFLAALSIANQDSDVLGSAFCLRCHTPIGYVRGKTEPSDGSELEDIDQGVGCETCHRMVQSTGADAPYVLGNAQIFYDNNIGKRGKYDDAESPAHPTVPDTGVLEARFCGQCHQVSNPERKLRDEFGAETEIDFPFETTFTEWESSVFSVEGGAEEAGCIDCHMPKQLGDWPYTSGFGAKLRKDPRKHSFAGGNHWGIQAVMEAYPERAAEFAPAFENALKSTLDMLATAVEVSIVSAPANIEPGQTFDITVRVENKAGHKFPTGYVDARQAWVSASLVDCTGEQRAVLGGYDTASGAIQAEPPTHVYRSIHGRWDGSAGVEEHSLALQDMHLSDTRIPPKGFVASLANEPSGDIDYSDGQGGWNHFDEATFTVTAPADIAGTQTLLVAVEFQSVRRAYVEYLRDANTTDQTGENLWQIYQVTGEAPPLRIASAETDVEAPGACDPGSGGAGGGGTGGDASGGAGATPAGNGGAGAAGATPDDDADEGCSCRQAGGGRGGAAGGGVLLLFAAALLARIRLRLR
jgi:hypothetical protein